MFQEQRKYTEESEGGALLKVAEAAARAEREKPGAPGQTGTGRWRWWTWISFSVIWRLHLYRQNYPHRSATILGYLLLVQLDFMAVAAVLGGHPTAGTGGPGGGGSVPANWKMEILGSLTLEEVTGASANPIRQHVTLVEMVQQALLLSVLWR
jgi:hypothetical protein